MIQQTTFARVNKQASHFDGVKMKFFSSPFLPLFYFFVKILEVIEVDMLIDS